MSISHKKKEGFTLLELLIVIAIMAILAVIVILVLNPAETLKKARDTQRMSDMATLKTALGLYVTTTSTPRLAGATSGQMGCVQNGDVNTADAKVFYSNNNVLVTADVNGGTGTGNASSTASSANLSKTDGSGWIPVNFDSLTGGAPISNLPIDPTNSIAAVAAPASTDLVYRYVCDSSNTTFEINAVLESDAYTVQNNLMANDGGNNPGYYEVGTKLNLLGAGIDF
jgi:prepilin-type N-terminal cleavage/methylation domain-containing protein